MPTTRLLEMINAFEEAYRRTGAKGGIDIGANVQVRFVPTKPPKALGDGASLHSGSGLFVSVDKGSPYPIVEADAGMIARVARELPKLAEQLDAGAQQIEQEIVKGEDVLGEWLKSRGLST